MEVIIFDEKIKDQYKEFLLKSEYKDILQSWEWGEVKPKNNWQVQRIGLVKNGELKGIAQILERRLLFGFHIYYIPRGPIIDWADLNLVKESISAIKSFFKNETKNKRTIFFRLEPPIQENEALEKIFKESGFRKYFKTVQPPDTLLIDLTKEDLLKGFRRTARNLIYRSQREGIQLEVKTKNQITRNDLLAFYNLYRLTGERFSFSLRPFEQFLILLKEMNESVNMRLYIAKIKGLALAYGIVLVLGDKAFYIWGGTGRHKEYSKFFNYGYIWGILEDLKKTGVKTFDFWGLGPEDQKNHPWHGFTLFKTAFNGQRLKYIGTFDLVASKAYPLFKILDKIITPKYRAASS